MNKLLKKVTATIMLATTIYSLAVAANAANGSETKMFSGVKLGNYEMSGKLIGDLTGGHAWTKCNKSVYYIATNVTGYVIAENKYGKTQRVDLGDRPLHKYNDTMVFTFIGGFEPTGVKTGSFWSSHEIRDGVNGVGHYLATIDV